MRHVVLDSFHRLEALHEGSPVYIGRGMGLLIQDGFNLHSNSPSADKNISIWSFRFGLFCNKIHHVRSEKPFCLELIATQEGLHIVSATMVSILLF